MADYVTGIELTDSELGVWLEWMLNPQSTAYNTGLNFKLEGSINLAAFEQSLQTIVSRHESLRSYFIEKNEQPLHFVEKTAKVHLRILDLSEQSFNKTKLDKLLNQLNNQIFDLAKYPLFDFTIIKISGEEYYFSSNMHQIIMDAMSLPIFFKELSDCYNAIIENTIPQLPEITLSVKDIVAHDKKFRHSAQFEEDLKFWKNFLTEESSDVNFSSWPGKSKDSISFYFTLPNKIKRLVEKFAKDRHVSTFMCLLACFKTLLYRYSGNQNFLINYPISIRSKESEYKTIMGYFVNPIFSKSRFNSTTRFFDVVKNLVLERKLTTTHQKLPFINIINSFRKDNLTEIQSLDNITFGSTYFGYNHNLKLDHIKATSLPVNLNDTQNDFSMLYEITPEEIIFKILCSRNKFNYRFITKFSEHFKTLVEKCIENPNILISEIDFLSHSEKTKLLKTWNKTDCAYPDQKTIHQLFEEQVARTPNNIAVVYQNTKLTYKELNNKANRLANFLREKHSTQGNDFIVLCLERSENILIAILAVLKSGAAYVPIDPSFPAERIQHIINDTKPKAILTNSVYKKKLAKIINDEKISIEAIDDAQHNNKITLYPETNPSSTITSQNLAYVIYTSGTTGNPKGVLIEHRNVVLKLFGFPKYTNMTNLDTLSTTNYVFDIFGLEYGLPLCNGFKIELIDLSHNIIDKKQKINIINYGFIQLTPSKVDLLLNNIATISKGNAAHELTLLIGGEALNSQVIKLLQQSQKNLKNSVSLKVFNVYGPTETTIWSTCKKLTLLNAQSQPISIGTPLFNEKIYILDQYYNLVPIGATGDIYIGGSALARGYLNQPELTTKAFISNPFQTAEEKVINKNSRLYKTGDLGRYFPNGDVEYIGRNDSQVKIRGFRIELGEIETRLANYPGIIQAVALAKEHLDPNGLPTGNYYLVGYYVSDTPLNQDSILIYLAEHLPDYMVPTALVWLNKLPLTINGKLDRKALPDPEFINVFGYVGPRNDFEAQVCGVYAEVLNLSADQIGIHDDFFRLGGNSILAIKLVNQLNSQILNPADINLTLAQLLRYKTIATLLDSLLSEDSSEAINIPRLPANPQAAPLSYAQERLWFIENYQNGSNAYNLYILRKLISNIDFEKLKQSLFAVVKRHEVLHSLIKMDDDAVAYQQVMDLDNFPLLIKHHEFNNHYELMKFVSNETNYVFHLNDEYPIRLYILYNNQNKEPYLFILIHHIAFDGWSTEVFIRDLEAYYSHRENKLPELTIQYKDFAVWQKHYLSGERLTQQLNYWKNKLADFEELHLPTDKPRPAEINYAGNTIHFNIEKSLSTQLRDTAKKHGVSLYSVLLAAFNLLLSVYSNQDDITIGTPIANRHHAQLEPLIGFFVNTLALRSHIDPEKNLGAYIEEVGKDIIEAQLHQDLPFEKLVEELAIPKDPSRHPLFQVMFGVQSFGEESVGTEEIDYKLFDSTHLESDYSAAKFDLSVFINDEKEELKGLINYAVSLFKQETIEVLIATYLHILEQIQDDAITIKELSLLNPRDYQKVMFQWNKTDTSYPVNKTIQELFEEQVEKNPDNIAIVFEGIKLSYRELNQRANQLAHYLQQNYFIEGNDLIALFLERNEQMPIAILAVLKSGAAYVPIDPTYPEERINHIINDSNPKAVLANESQRKKLSKLANENNFFIDITYIDNDSTQIKLQKCSTVNLTQKIDSKNLAYVIYTSGTTGKPKGVMIEHTSVINLITIQTNMFGLQTDKTINYPLKNCLWYSNYVFDAHVWDLFVTISNGNVLHIINDDIRKNIDLLAHYIDTHKIQIATVAPALLSVNNLLRLETLVVAGEKTETQILNFYNNNKIQVINAYGPSESTVCATFNNYTEGDLNTNIGKPGNNIKLYILNDYLKPLPIGAIGELYIGGVGLAQGYLNLPELTAEKFINNPFQTEEEKINDKNNRIYRTGDLARYLPNGDVEYIGRNDSQVKIRGFRIELGEIETRLANYPGIIQAVALAKEHLDPNGLPTGNYYLVGYYVSDAPLNQDSILIYLAEHLPDYMVPTALVWLNKLPLTINGKLDRKALPDPEFINVFGYVGPRNDLEAQVCGVYAEVLHLAQDQVGIHDDFFRLGGNSILAIRLVSRLNSQIFYTANLNLTLAQLFRYKTIATLLDSLLSEDSSEAVNIPRLPADQQIASLSYAQERLWFIETFAEGSNAYNIPIFRKLTASLDMTQLERSLCAVVERHEVLHSLIKTNSEGIGYQEIIDLTVMPVSIAHHQFQNRDEMMTFVQKESNHIFQLNAEYPIRIHCLNVANQQEKYLFIIVHHIAFDGWSIDVFIRDLEAYYSHSENKLPELSIQYKDFAVWQKNYLNGERLTHQLNYWKSKLADFEGLHLPSDKSRPAAINYKGNTLYFNIKNSLSNQLRETAKKHGVSLYSVLLAAFNLLLRAYSNQDDIIIGTPIANRHHAQLEPLVGFFVNSLALRSHIDPEKTLGEYIEEVGKDIIEAQLHQDLPFEKLVEELAIPKDPSRHPLFQVMFGVQSFGGESAQNETIDNDLFASNYLETDYTVAKFDLTTFIDDSEIELKCMMNYAVSLFTQETIDTLISTYLHILEQLPNDIVKIKQLRYLNAKDYQRILIEWNQTAQEYPSNKTIQQLFEEQVERTPNSIAVIFENTKLTYNQLNQRANQLAHYLKKSYHIKGDDLIALCLDRSERMLIAILAVLKSAAAYVPIDPNFPTERIQHIIHDTKPKVILTNNIYQEKLVEIIHDAGISVDAIDSVQHNIKITLFPETNPISTITSRNLAYVIYTSGTSGKPKGVMINHLSVINTITALKNIYALSEGDKTTEFTSYVFDVSVSEVFVTLFNGAELHLLDETIRTDVDSMSHYILAHKINVCYLPPAILSNLPKINYPDLDRIIYAGEPCDRETGKYWSNKKSLFNYFGPTETAIYCLGKQVVDGDVNLIGKPLANTSAYVLDNNLNPLPIGAIGELYIGGDGLARGYLHLPKLTTEKFISNPFQTENEKQSRRNSRLYKTGDLVRYLSDGNIEYIGRNDFQVKIRGFRIELGEIETRLANYPGIIQAVALAKEHLDPNGLPTGNYYLVGYYVSDMPLNQDSILIYLAEHLPDYMVPTALVWLNKLPLTINGKLDRKALPDPEFINVFGYVGPRNDLEAQVCGVYAEVLHLPPGQVGIHDDFFRLGGNSILAIRLVSRLNSQIFYTANLNLTLAQLFRYKTIATLLDSLLSEDSSEAVHIPRLPADQQIASLSYAQERLWFIETFAEGSNAYNIPIFRKLTASLDMTQLERSLCAVVERHEVLHSLIKTNSEGIGYQEIIDLTVMPVSIAHHQFQNRDEMMTFVQNESNHIFQLNIEYPIRIHCLDVANQQEKYLFIIVHHIAFDGWSIDVFIRDLEAYYSHSENKLPELSIQYKDFAVWQKNYLNGERLTHQLNYWKNKLADFEGLHLPSDKPRPTAINYKGNTLYFNIKNSLSNQLRETAKKHGVSLYSVLLAAFNLLLRAYSNQDDIIIGTPIANRHHAQLEPLVGFFVNSLALRSHIDPEKTLGEYIEEVGKDIIEAQLHQDLPFEKLVEELAIPKDPSRHPLFQVMFGVQSFGGESAQNETIDNDLFASNYLETDYTVAKFDLTTFIDDSQIELKCMMNYAVSLFTQETIDTLISTYLHILEQLAHDTLKIKQLSYLNTRDYQKTIITWNQTAQEYPSNKTIQQLFEEQVERTPNSIAVIFENTKLTYIQLNQRSNQLAHYLKKSYHIKGDDLIALCLDRSELLIISILAVLKAGAAFVPMEPSYPNERIVYMLKDTQAKAILSTEIYKNTLSQLICNNQIVTTLELIDSREKIEQLNDYSLENPNPKISSQNLAYVIYTSGTTGTPKGVLIEHRNVVLKLFGFPKFTNMNNLDTLSTTSYVFDIFGLEYGLPLSHGFKIELIDLPHHIIDKKQKINISNYGFIQLTPSKADMLLSNISAISRGNASHELTLLIGGESLNSQVIKLLQQINNKLKNSIKLKVFNVYGPTETTIWSTCKKISFLNTQLYPISIGTPLFNEKIYILDQYYNPVPIGAIGEIYIGGAALARGYLNQPELTVKAFIANPFQNEEEKSTQQNTTLYKTGDLGRYLPNGDIEYIGRNDFQVKIRGFRIELGEIETCLANYPGIIQAVALAKEHLDPNGLPTGNYYLVGYYVSDAPLNQDSILIYLAEHLPDYMVPTALVWLNKLPLTINGKLDRKALPDPEFINVFGYVGPRNDLEAQVCGVYAEVLHLAQDQVGIHDDFFRLGGNSILAIRLVSRLNSQIFYTANLNLTLAQLFRYKTIATLLDSLLSEDSSEAVNIPRIPADQNIASLSYAQERLWFIETFAEGSNAYNIPIFRRLTASLGMMQLERSLCAVVERHEVLHSLIKTNAEGIGYQEIIDLTVMPVSIAHHQFQNEDEMMTFVQKESNHIFQLNAEYPIRIHCLNVANQQEKYLFIIVHHIAFDGWSIDVFIRDLEAYYSHSENKLPELSIQYKDFSVWQKNYLNGERLTHQLNYWKNKLADFEGLHLPSDKPRPTAINYKGNTLYFNIKKSLSNQLRETAKKHGVSLYSVLLAAFNLLLRAYSNQDDIIIGTPIANRHHAQLEPLVGFFVNSLALRSHIDPEKTLGEYIEEIGKDIIEAQLHQDLPFEKLVEELAIPKDPSRHPLFQVMFGVQSFGGESSQNKTIDDDLFASNYLETDYTVAKFDLTTFIDDSQIELKCMMNYAVSLFTQETIDTLISTYLHILEQLAHDTLKIKQLSYLNTRDYQKTIITWNQTAQEYPSNKTIQQLFEEQVEKNPNNIAVVYQEIKLTYKELNQKSNRLANYLRKTYSIKGDDFIALCLDRSESMLIAILAVLKSAAAYVPIDPNFPTERIQHIIHDTKPKVILTNNIYQEKLMEIIHNAGISVDAIDSAQHNIKITLSPETNPISTITSRNLAYVIYTSGTSGKPKGVMINHLSVINTITALKNIYALSQGDKATEFTAYVFDVSVSEIFVTLFNGAELHLLDETTRTDVDSMSHYLLAHKINVCYLPPAILSNLPKINYPDLDRIIYAGEPCDRETGKYWSNKKSLFNYFGPTETAIYCLGKQVVDGDVNLIGKPLANTSAYVLDNNLNPLPIGAIGELYIGGDGLARGYLHLPKLTTEKFIPNPFQTENEKQSRRNSRLYKTGDLVRYLSDGNIEYIGRNDFQVKIRGFRIELSEIETILTRYADIKQAAVVTKNHLDQNGLPTGNYYLVGYYVSDKSLNPTDILNFLSDHLPEYMIPTALVWLNKLPITINGKLDRKALPDPELTNALNYESPRNDLEQKICNIYAAVLGLPPEQVGIKDDFFRLGGDSIHSIQLVSRLRQNLGIKLSIKELFANKTVEKLYKILADQIVQEDHILREQGILSGNFDLLPIQSWFFNNVEHKLFKNPEHWNQSFLIKAPKLNFETLKLSLLKLIEYHDAFRLNFRLKTNGEYEQYYQEVTPLDVLYLDVSQLSEAKCQTILTRWQSDFELLGTMPLYKIGYLEGYADGSSRIFFALHHLIIDAVSWRIITHDLQTLYQMLLSNVDNSGKQSAEEILGKKGTSYRQWVEEVARYHEMYPTEINYWYQLLDDLNDSQQNLFFHTTKNPNSIEFNLSSEETHALTTQSNVTYHTEINDLLLTAFGLALEQFTKNSIHYITLEGHGREEYISNTDVTRTLGWFTTMFPVKLSINPKNIQKSIISVKESLRKTPNKGIGFGALLRNKAYELPKILFNYLGKFDQRVNSLDKKDWSISDEASGLAVSKKNQNSNIIDVNGAVVNQKLYFSFNAKLKKTDVEQLALHFKQQLLAVIAHTITLKRSYLTTSDVDYIISQAHLNQLQAKHMIDKIYLANSLQQGFIYHAINNPSDTAYRVQLLAHYTSNLDPETLRMAWQRAQQHYPSLRLRFNWDDDLVQIIDRHQDLVWQYLDFSQHNKLKQESLLEELLINDRKNPYDLKKGPLFRIFLIKWSERSHNFVLSYHHSILDGWSIPLLFKFVHELYLKLQGSNPNLHKKIIDAIPEEEAYINTQRYLQQHQVISEEYWQNQLARIEDYPDLTGLLKPSKRQIHLSEYRMIIKKAEARINFKDELYKKIITYSAEHGVTINAVLQYCWHKLLHKYGHSQTTIIGTTISGRNLPIDHIEESVGLFINTLPLIVSHADGNTILEELRQLQTTIYEMNGNSSINLSKLQPGARRLFDTLFVYENYPESEKIQDDSIQFNLLRVVEELDYPLAVVAYEHNNQINCAIKFAAELFSKDTIYSLLEKLQSLLYQITSGTTSPTTLSYLTSQEYMQIVFNWNQTETEYPSNKTIQQLFEEQVERTPNNIAVVFENTKLTYSQLNQRANQLAYYLIKTYHIKGDDLIALCLDRSEQLLIAILAVLKSGAAYLPIDPEYPDERTAFILNDAKPKVILVNKIYSNKISKIISNKDLLLPTEEIEYLNDMDLLKNYPTLNLPKNINSQNLAYVIYTSGTTGDPKGVMIEHRSVINLITMQSKEFNLTPTNSTQFVQCLWYANYVFDAHVWELFTVISNGHTIHILDNESRYDTDLLSYYIENKQIHMATIPPALLTQNKLLKLKKLIVAGEKTDKRILDYYKENHIEVYNAYGPTEATVCVTINNYSTTDLNNNIGKPLGNTRCYILDKYLHPLPIGAIGELYVGGIGIARSYLNQPELTAEKFITNPFQTEEEQKVLSNPILYKTGDLVRYLANGDIEYIGRADFQVKIRGFRIELGEIETALLGFSEIKQAVALAKDHIDQNGLSTNTKYLVGYYVSKDPLDHADIFKYLAEHLPEYMLPTALVWLNQLPLTINGKLDRNALPDPDLTSLYTYAAPRNHLEQEVCAVYAEILNLPAEQVGIHDDFFRLGGNSILVIKLVSHLNAQVFNHQKLRVEIRVAELFKYKTIAALCESIFANMGTKEIQRYLPTDHDVNMVGKMIFIPPGGGGFEVYQELAELLSEQYDCIGIDNYNIYHESQIDTLEGIANYYVSLLRNHYDLNGPIYLCGWSLGGQIALEMAYLFEKEGFHNLVVICLDTILPDKKIIQSRSHMHKALKDKFLNILAQKYSGDYAIKVANAFESDNKILLSKNHRLEKTQVILYKALYVDNEFYANIEGMSALNQYILTLANNNIDKISHNLITLNLPCHHGNIIEFIIQQCRLDPAFIVNGYKTIPFK